jgi:hypothetical protein
MFGLVTGGALTPLVLEYVKSQEQKRDLEARIKKHGLAVGKPKVMQQLPCCGFYSTGPKLQHWRPAIVTEMNFSLLQGEYIPPILDPVMFHKDLDTVAPDLHLSYVNGVIDYPTAEDIETGVKPKLTLYSAVRQNWSCKTPGVQGVVVLPIKDRQKRLMIEEYMVYPTPWFTFPAVEITRDNKIIVLEPPSADHIITDFSDQECAKEHLIDGKCSSCINSIKPERSPLEIVDNPEYKRVVAGTKFHMQEAEKAKISLAVSETTVQSLQVVNSDLRKKYEQLETTYQQVLTDLVDVRDQLTNTGALFDSREITACVDLAAHVSRAGPLASLHRDSRVILVLGDSGAGKSTFLNTHTSVNVLPHHGADLSKSVTLVEAAYGIQAPFDTEIQFVEVGGPQDTRWPYVEHERMVHQELTIRVPQLTTYTCFVVGAVTPQLKQFMFLLGVVSYHRVDQSNLNSLRVNGAPSMCSVTLFSDDWSQCTCHQDNKISLPELNPRDGLNTHLTRSLRVSQSNYDVHVQQLQTKLTDAEAASEALRALVDASDAYLSNARTVVVTLLDGLLPLSRIPMFWASAYAILSDLKAITQAQGTHLQLFAASRNLTMFSQIVNKPKIRIVWLHPEQAIAYLSQLPAKAFVRTMRTINAPRMYAGWSFTIASQDIQFEDVGTGNGVMLVDDQAYIVKIDQLPMPLKYLFSRTIF